MFSEFGLYRRAEGGHDEGGYTNLGELAKEGGWAVDVAEIHGGEGRLAEICCIAAKKNLVDGEVLGSGKDLAKVGVVLDQFQDLIRDQAIRLARNNDSSLKASVTQ